MSNKLNGRKRNRRTVGKGSLSLYRLEDRLLLAADAFMAGDLASDLAAGEPGREIEVRARGIEGGEQFRLRVGDTVVGTYTTTQAFQTFNYTSDVDVALAEIQVEFFGDQYDPDNGIDTNLVVDHVRLDGEVHETEAPTTYSTGTWRPDVGLTPGYYSQEWLHSNGYFHFGQDPGNTGSVLSVRARGDEGGEQFRLIVDGRTVGTFTVTTEYQDFGYTAPGQVDLSDVEIEYFGDRYDAANNIDANLQVDFVQIDGVNHQAEAATTYSTGTWRPGGVQAGYWNTEYLHVDGRLIFGHRDSGGGSEIIVRAAGQEGSEQFALQINGATVETFSASTTMQEFRYQTDETVAAADVRVVFLNDLWDPANNIDRNLQVDRISIDGVVWETEADTTLSTGTWADGGVTPGFKQSEFLHSGGYFQYDAASPEYGEISLGTSLVQVGEGELVAELTIVRRNGSDGTITVEYNTLNSSAVAGQDFEAASGVATFAPGETEKTISITLIDDQIVEADEQFSFAIDAVNGGATLLAPRTATIVIDDNDSISATGDGLLGEYFDNIDFTNRFPPVVDATVNFNWGLGAPRPTMGVDNFSVRWTGQVEPRYTETYTFQTRSDDGVRLWVDNQLIIDQWVDQSATNHTGQISLNAGQKYDIKLEYYERSVDAVMQLRWASASQALEIIPQSQLYAAEPTAPPIGDDLVAQNLRTDLTQPTSADFTPDGQNMYITEKSGVVKVLRNGQLSTFTDISRQVNNTRDRGLLDLAVHPDFENNPYVYLLFTHDPPEVHSNTSHTLARPDGNGNRAGRMIRVTADASTGYTTAVAGSEVVILGTNSVWANFNGFANSTTDFSEPAAGVNADGTNLRDFIATDSESHSVGAVEFGPDGALYVSIGDGTSYNRVDPRTVRVQDLDNLSGKVLRIDPLTGAGLPDNPYFVTGDAHANRSKVYQSGLRNPFRMSFDAEGQLYVGDVGWTQWEEINVGPAGANFGWPYYEGGSGNNLRTNGYRDLPQAAAFYASGTVATPALYALNHAATGINAIVMGAVYTGDVYPQEFRGDLFFNDLGQGIVRNISLDQNDNVANVQTFANGAQYVVAMVESPDGHIYYVDLDNGTVGRWVFV